MVEVFKTNVEQPEDAERLVLQIHARFIGWQASFDLTDCDRILRIEGIKNEQENIEVITLLSQQGYAATPL